MAERSWWGLSRLPGEGDVCEETRTGPGEWEAESQLQ